MNGAVAFTLTATRTGNTLTLKGNGEARGWSVCLRNVQQISGVKGASHVGSEWGVVVKAEGNEVLIHL
ncbi:Alpha-xylosidase [compost metagenome]